MKRQLVTLYITRHGKTMLNTAERVQGWADSPLTKAGVEVAEALGVGLGKDQVIFDAAYSSDSGRAIETAEIVINKSGQRGLEFIKNKQLREVNFGKYEGDLNENMWGDILRALNVDSMVEVVKLGLPKIVDTIAALDETKQAETWEQVSLRVKESFEQIAEKQAEIGGGNVLIVTHGMTISVLLSQLDSTYQVSELDNASVTQVEYEAGKYTVKTVGDMSFVEKGSAKLHL